MFDIESNLLSAVCGMCSRVFRSQTQFFQFVEPLNVYGADVSGATVQSS